MFFSDPQAGGRADAQGQGHIASVYTGGPETVASTRLPGWAICEVNKTPCESPIFILQLRDGALMACFPLRWPCGKQRKFVL